MFGPLQTLAELETSVADAGLVKVSTSRDGALATSPLVDAVAAGVRARTIRPPNAAQADYFLRAPLEARDLVAADFPASLAALPAPPATFLVALTMPPAARRA